MSIHHHLRRAKPTLMAALLVCAALFIGEIFFVNSRATLYPTKTEFLLMLLPPFGVVLCMMPLVYLSWFGPDAPTFLKIPKLIFFWMMAAVWVYGFGLFFLIAI